MNDEIDWGDIGDHGVDVVVERGFKDLRPDQDEPSPSRVVARAERRSHFLLDLQPFTHGEAGMQQNGLDRAVMGADHLDGLDGVVDGNADPGDAAALCCDGCDVGDRLLECPYAPDSNGACAIFARCRRL